MDHFSYDQRSSKRQRLAHDLWIDIDDKAVEAHSTFITNTADQIDLIKHEASPNFGSLPDALWEDYYAEDDFFDQDNEIVETEEQVCYGMITGIEATVSINSFLYHSDRFPVILESPTTFRYDFSGMRGTGHISEAESWFINGLLEEASLQLQVACCSVEKQATRSASRECESSVGSTCFMSIILYGPYSLAEDTLYLRARSYQMTFDLNLTNERTALEDFRGADADDVFGSFQSDEDLHETAQPDALRSTLHSHQRQALTFLLRQEGGRSLFDMGDTWTSEKTIVEQRFLSKMTNPQENYASMPFYGGILADPPGLGKSLTMLSLISTDFSSTKRDEVLSHRVGHIADFIDTSLIIVPPGLLANWKNEITKHFHPNTITLFQHHGHCRLSSASEAGKYNIILTTYHTLATDWKKSVSSEASALFAATWRRVILDEAHWIRNGASRLAIAACSLQALSRWAVTGTPLQNRLADFSTLLRFIRVHPYDHPNVFKREIADKLRFGGKEIAMKQLKTLLRSVMFSRPKTTIKLPPRYDAICPLSHAQGERHLYDDYRNKALKIVDTALQSGSVSPDSYFNALQQINALRMICNLGIYYSASKSETSRDKLLHSVWNSETAQNCFNNLAAMQGVRCSRCRMDIETLLQQLTPSLREDGVHAQFSRCQQILCSSCSQNTSGTMDKGIICGHLPPCALASISLNTDVEETKFDIPRSFGAKRALPTKVTELVRQLKNSPPEIKSLVYSFWTSTLDLIAQALDNLGICYVRFDGRLPLKARQDAVQKLQHDPGVHVMLLTLSCGGIGLNLTAATRAYLMEPHWNPTVEEQALARIHRLGQEKEVTTVRFMMKDSIEEHVIRIQKSKTAIADLILATGNRSQATGNMERLEGLRSLL